MHNHRHILEFSIGVSFVLGVLHASEPGHGKSAMFVYMLQQSKSFWHPIVVGVTTGLSHAASLMVIALAVHLGVHLLSGPNASSLPTTLPLTIEQCEKLVEMATFEGRTGQIELINGRIVRMDPQGPQHSDPIDFLTEWSFLSQGHYGWGV